MKARILFVSDLHKRDCDFTTIQGYTNAVDAVQRDLLLFIKKAGITHLISLGDWYDKGYRSINRHSNDRNLDEEFSRAVNGNFYICLGNHFFLERDNNPEMYLIQPHNLYRPTNAIYAQHQIIRAPDHIQIGGVRISLFHYSKKNKSYHVDLDPSVTYHIGVYHDEVVVPSYVQKDAGLIGGKPSTNLDFLLNNVNLAIVGHLHKPIGAVKIQAGARTVPMIIPGSLANTANSSTFHETVNLPVIEIGDDDNVSCMLYTFSLHTDLLRLYKRKESPTKAILPEQAVMSIPQTINARDFLRAKGFTENHITLVDEASERTLDPLTGLRLLGIVGGAKQ